MSRGLVLQPYGPAPPGLLSGWARERGVALAVAGVEAELPGPQDHDFAVLLGTTASLAQDPPPWAPALLAWLRAAERPVLGICFGAQALGAAFGGSVRRLPAPEIDWITIDTDEPTLVAPGPWVAWHEDAITLPAGARELASNAVGTQAFAIERHLGVQFHPEATPAIVERWARDDGVAGGPLLAAVREGAEAAAARAHALFDAFHSRV